MPDRGSASVLSAVLVLLAATAAHGQEPEQLVSEPLAEAFGAAPLVRGLRLSPDGKRISVVQMHPDHYPLVNVFDLASGAVTTVLAGERERYDIRWCRWANEERLLCSLRYVGESWLGNKSPRTRLAAVNADGSQATLLLQRDRALGTTQYQDRVIDWLPDDAEHVLLGLRIFSSASRIGSGSRVARLDIYDSSVRSVDSAQDDAVEWITDGYGTPRLHATVSRTHRTWYVREREDGAWSRLHQTRLRDLDDEFSPIAFDREADEVLFYDRLDGRAALFALELDNDRARRLVYAHPRVDVSDVHRIGRRNRIVAAVAIEDRPVLHFFDPGVERVYDMLEPEFPGMSVNVIDEDWAERRYLVFVNSDRDPGTYYVFDTEGPELVRFAPAFPTLGERELAVTQPLGYPAANGGEIPGYLTLPPGGASGAGIVLPHGGPAAGDYWQFDYLAQFLAARGYAVLQSKYRGSAGFGEEWFRDNGFKEWRGAVDDIADGARYLAEAGVADPGRICVVGWGYGGYLALLSAIEHERLYRCVVSIAGVTDPILLSRNAGNFVGGDRTRARIGSDGDVRREGSPLRRADEILLPTLLFHPHDDVEVPVEHSTRLNDAMRDLGADVELIEYEHAEHDIRPAPYRIDMLARLGGFLAAHLDSSAPDFYADAPTVANPVEIVDFGIDASRPDTFCGDARFRASDGSVLREAGRRATRTHNDATDCRRLFASGEILLAASLQADRSGNVPATERVTLFVDPAQQTRVGLTAIDGETLGRGVAIVHARPGYRVLNVRATDLEYACTVGFAAAGGASNAAEPAYVVRPASSAEASQVRIPAYAGRFYRIEVDVNDGLLLVRVTDTTDGRVVLDQRALVGSRCE